MLKKVVAGVNRDFYFEVIQELFYVQFRIFCICLHAGVILMNIFLINYFKALTSEAINIYAQGIKKDKSMLAKEIGKKNI